jgi:hypothetical protein
LAFGLAIVFVIEAQDTTFRSERDVERLLKLPALAMVPLLNAPKASNDRGLSTVPQSPPPAIAGTAS